VPEAAPACFSVAAFYISPISPASVMEPELTDVSRSEPPAVGELRALAQLRDRVETAAREVERLRAENAALASRVTALQTRAGDPAALPLPESAHAEKLRAQIQGFIEAIDRVLAAAEPASAPRQRDA
jgi:hypothetical protein